MVQYFPAKTFLSPGSDIETSANKTPAKLDINLDFARLDKTKVKYFDE